MAFAFRPARILRLRRLALREQQRELAVRLRREHALAERLDALRRAIDSAVMRARHSLMCEVVELPQVIHDRHRLGRLQADAGALIGELAAQRQCVASQRTVVAERLKGVRILENLEARQRMQYDTEQRACDAAELDERGIMQAARLLMRGSG